MNELVEYIVKSLVSNPDAVKVEQSEENGEVRLLLTVDDADMGMVIGKNGQTIKSIRKLLTVRAMAENVRVYLQLNEPEGGKPREEKEEEEAKEQAPAEKSEPETPVKED